MGYLQTAVSFMCLMKDEPHRKHDNTTKLKCSALKNNAPLLIKTSRPVRLKPQTVKSSLVLSSMGSRCHPTTVQTQQQKYAYLFLTLPLPLLFPSRSFPIHSLGLTVIRLDLDLVAWNWRHGNYGTLSYRGNIHWYLLDDTKMLFFVIDIYIMIEMRIKCIPLNDLKILESNETIKIDTYNIYQPIYVPVLGTGLFPFRKA